MKGPVHVLIVADSVEDGEQLLLELTRAGMAFYSERVDNHGAMSAALSAMDWDVILCSSCLRTFSYKDALDLVKKSGIDAALIVVSTEQGEAGAVTAMRSGAADYIWKGNLARLGPVVERELREIEGRREHRAADEKITFMAYYDPLTGLPNRALLKDRFCQAVARAKRNKQMVALMFLDIDRFKNINDSMGHAAGDLLLKDVVSCLETCVREEDTLCRWGGDEFVLLFTELDQVETAAKIAQRLLESLNKPLYVDSQELFVTASIGISLYPNDGEDMDTLLRNSDTAMYRVKEQSRNQYQLYARAMNARAYERLAMETSLRHAIDRDELVVYYQPQFDLETRNMIGVEALIRWHHPEMGFIYPSQFIPLAEETGLIIPMGQWVLRAACAQAKEWERQGLSSIRVNVNLSARQFQDRKLVEIVAGALDESGLRPELLELEITKSIAMQYEGFTLTMLRDLKAMGVQTSIDDFGTGYSLNSSSYQFLFDKLKIDHGFVKGIGNGSEGSAIVTTLVSLGRSLNRRVIAAGVETEQQLNFLHNAGCHEVQGYLFSRPVPPEEIPPLVARNVLSRGVVGSTW